MRTKIVNLTLQFDQQKQFFVRRIEFSGNTTTRDKVIRRELLLDEGQVFNNRYWELSILRLNQLGYFDTIKPENAELKTQREGRHGGYQVEGEGEGQAVDQLLGRRQRNLGQLHRLLVSDQQFPGTGRNAHAFGADWRHPAQHSISDSRSRICSTGPFRPGFTIFSQKFDYNTARQEGILLGQQVAIDPALQENYNTDSKGFTIFASYPLRKLSFTRLGVSYGWSTTDITPFSQSATLLFESTKFTSLAGPSALNGIRQSQITPTLTYNTVDSPVFPTHGKSFYLRRELRGRPAAGERQHDQQHVRHVVLSTPLPPPQRDCPAFRNER